MSGTVITVKNDGSYYVKGDFTLVTEGGKPIVNEDGQEAWLCRCGQSSTKPFCDSTHRKVKFQSNLDNPAPKVV